jgi:hypothetical protein
MATAPCPSGPLPQQRADEGPYDPALCTGEEDQFLWDNLEVRCHVIRRACPGAESAGWLLNDQAASCECGWRCTPWADS